MVSPAKTAEMVQKERKALKVNPDRMDMSAQMLLMGLEGLMVPKVNQAKMVTTDCKEGMDLEENMVQEASTEKWDQ